MVVVAAACPIMVLQLQPHLVAALCGVGEFCGGRFLGAAGGAVAVAALRKSVLSLLSRFVGVAFEELWRFGCLPVWSFLLDF